MVGYKKPNQWPSSKFQYIREKNSVTWPNLKLGPDAKLFTFFELNKKKSLKPNKQTNKHKKNPKNNGLLCNLYWLLLVGTFNDSTENVSTVKIQAS